MSTPLSWKIVTTANCTYSMPFETGPIAIWNETVGTPVTATVECIGAAIATDKEVWIELEFLGDASSPQGSFVTDSADILATAANQTSSSETWGGSTAAFKLAVSFTAQQPGWVYARIKIGKASSTFYVDPMVTLAPYVPPGATIDMNFAAGTISGAAAFTDVLSCSRASTGYAQTVAGTLTSFAANTLRRTDKGLLIEEARTNYQLNSQDFSSGYNYLNASITLNTVAAPDGTITADTMTDSTALDSHRFYCSGTAGAGVHTWSIYVKAGTLSWCKVMASGANEWANFNVTTGALGNKSAGVTGHLIEALAGGWYRCSMTCSPSFAYFEFHLLNLNDASGFASWAGTGSGTLHLWGAQIEAGSYPTSYIPTTTAAVTRAADLVQAIGAADTILDGAAASAVVSIDVIPRTTSVSIMQSSGEVPLYKVSPTTIDSYSSVGMGPLAKTGLASAVTNASKYGVAWTRAGGRSITGQGLAVATDASVLTPVTMCLGSSGSADYIDTYIRQLELWNTRISDAELVTETT